MPDSPSPPPQDSGPAATQIRTARLGDAAAIAELVNRFAAQGLMLPRNPFETAESIRDFLVAESGARLVGVAALRIYTLTAGEVRSLAVDPDAQSHGLGRRLVEAIEAEALALGLSQLFAFTYVPGFFAKLGFQEVDRNRLPQKAWKDCLKCPKFTACDEIAVEKAIRAIEPPIGDTPFRGYAELPLLDTVFPIPVARK